MRTKTLLMSAAALLAAGIVSSQAQPVYSQNIVGYASVATPASGVYYMITIPFAIGVSNGVNEIWPLANGQPTIPDYSSILVWNAGSQNFTTYISDSTSPTLWDDTSYTPLAFSPKLPVGQGFFLNLSASNVTNTFAGTVAVNVGTSNKMAFNSSGIYYMVGSVVPYAGAVTNGNPTTGAGGLGLSSLTGLPDYSSLLTWNPVSQSFVTYISDSTSPSGWDDTSYSPLAAPPNVSVGQGFFLNLSGSYTWTVGL